MRTRKAFLVLVSLAWTVTFATRPTVATLVTDADDFGARAYSYTGELSAIRRDARTPGQEIVAAMKIQSWFQESGYQADLQPFSYRDTSRRYDSQNVVAHHPSNHTDEPERPLVIVGAHYDARPEGEGADDNASGGVILELAGRLKDSALPYDLLFVAFGAEEAGVRGSSSFVKNMSQADIRRTIVMINFDSLIAGDKLYIHAGFNRRTWARDAMLDIIHELDLPIDIQHGLNRKYPAGLTPNGFSDYTAFNKKGIPIVAFESTNWEIGNLDGYEETELYGPIWHTANDVLATIESLFPGRAMVRLQAYTELNYEFLVHLDTHSSEEGRVSARHAAPPPFQLLIPITSNF